MSDNDINILKRMPLKKVFESKHWTEKLVTFSSQHPEFNFSFDWIAKAKSGV